MTDNNKLSFVRIAWKVHGQQGADNWCDISQIASLEFWLDTANAKYGAGSHFLEYDDGHISHDVTQKIIKDAMSPKALG